jgi:hypothetical protein
MAETAIVPLTLALEDPDLDPEELETLTQNTQRQLRDIAEEVQRVPIQDNVRFDSGDDLLAKGDKKEPGLLQMEVNLENLKTVAAWIYQRVAGRSTKAKLKFGEGSNAIEFEFEGNNQKDLAATMQEMTLFVEKITQIQQAKS